MRTEAFDTLNTGPLDKVIWALRTAQVRRHLPPQVETIADLGCGHTAPLLQNLLSHRNANRAIGVDLAPDFEVEHEQLKMIEGDLNNALDLQDECTDVAFSLAVIEHLHEPNLHTREIYRVLKPGGILLLTTPSPRGKPLLEFLAYKLHVIDRREIDDHKQYFDSTMLRTTLEQAGFASAAIDTQTFQFGMNNIVVAKK